MPSIYLSPSTQEFNSFVNDGTEEYYMNLITDAMIPYLEEYGIEFGRNTKDMTAGSSLRQSNAGNYDFHLAIHSNASGEDNYGKNRGTIIFHYPNSSNGLKMSEIMEKNFKEISPVPDKVNLVPTTSLGEVSRTKAPSVLIEVAYHDNVEDANWIKENVDLIGKTLAQSVAEYFDKAIVESPGQTNGEIGKVTLNSGYLNIRSEPSINSPVIGMAPNGGTLSVLQDVGEWYEINYNGTSGYVYGKYITFD
jgi:N-acetylmuramoyl-L-alanine amidase